VKSARPLLELAAAHGVEMPIGQQVADVLEGTRTPADAIPALMLVRPNPSSTGSRARDVPGARAGPGPGVSEARGPSARPA
jgi:hypothetical protein